jgi:hypothetical protein
LMPMFSILLVKFMVRQKIKFRFYETSLKHAD